MKKQLSNKRVDDDNDNPEWSKADFAKAVPFSGLPAKERAMLSSRKRGPQLSPKKVPVSIRLSLDVAEGLRATGEGWQTRADEALRMWLAKGKKTAAR
jgi:uncharacterized protein (DUF4415 family)